MAHRSQNIGSSNEPEYQSPDISNEQINRKANKRPATRESTRARKKSKKQLEIGQLYDICYIFLY
jgi:hypothetical protein